MTKQPGKTLPPSVIPVAARLRLRVTAAAESILRAGHPWLFAESVKEQNRAGVSGELAVIYDRKDRFLALGLFDPDSPIRVRILIAGKPQTIDRAWWRERLQLALDQRRGLFDAQTTGYRLVNGESDGWPGLVLDRYDATLVLKLYTAAWLPRLEELVGLIRDLHPSGPMEALAGGESGNQSRIVLRLSRNIQKTAESSTGQSDGQILEGPNQDEPAIFRESGLRFEADAVRGQKTGFFLDQRENRRWVETLARGRSVLNAFSFSGGFSLYAARGGARSVTDLDISDHALAGAKRNFQLNQSDPKVARCPHATAHADAFEWLENGAGQRFDLTILDPPSLARREAERAGAISAYGRLAALGIRALNRGGTLVAASCSAHVTAAEFFDAVRESAVKSGRKFSVLRTTRHAPDHQPRFREAEYLKAIYVQLDG
jgi:23S rRNA (cytosine1962-C5)-methyltransferase